MDVVIGALALAGMLPLAGFFAKDREVSRIANRTGRLDVDSLLRDARGAALRALHRSAPVPGVLRGTEERGGGARPRIAARDDRTARGAGGRGRGDRPHPLDRRGGHAHEVPRAGDAGPVPEGEGLSTLALSVIADGSRSARSRSAWWVYASGRVGRTRPPRTAAAAAASRPRPTAYVDQGPYSTLFVNPGIAAARSPRTCLRREGRRGLVNGVGGGVRRLAAARRRSRPVRAWSRSGVWALSDPPVARDPAVNKLLTLPSFIPLLGALMVLAGGRGLKDEAARWGRARGVGQRTSSCPSSSWAASISPPPRNRSTMIEMLAGCPRSACGVAVGIDGLSVWTLLLATFLFPVSILRRSLDESPKDVRRYLAAIWCC